MYIRIPFEKEIDFKTNVSEITKMSLEQDFNVNDNVVLGNFYISGEYKTHEVSINTENFNYTLPFEVELREDINKDTLEFNIEDFSYDIKDNKTLYVNIEYSLKALVNKPQDDFEKVDENELKNELDYIDDFLEKRNSSDEETINNEETNAESGEKKQDLNEDNSIEEKRLDIEDEKTVMENIKDSDDTFVTYHVHIVKENETLESICNKYSVTSDLIGEYNEINSINLNDKIIIPKVDE